MKLQIKKTDFDAIESGKSSKVIFHINDYYSKLFGFLGLAVKGEPNGSLKSITLFATSFESKNGDKIRIEHKLTVTAALFKEKDYYNGYPRETYVLRISSVNENVIENHKTEPIDTYAEELAHIAKNYRENPVDDKTLISVIKSVLREMMP